MIPDPLLRSLDNKDLGRRKWSQILFSRSIDKGPWERRWDQILF
jgi:sarcosine oxidase delta subunit